MKKYIFILLFTIIYSFVSAQEYNIEKLKIIATVWGECYLFHPSVVSADKDLNWEKQLVDFLPKVKQTSCTKELKDYLNSDLLSALHDPFTVVQSNQKPKFNENELLSSCGLYDYLKISEKKLSEIESIVYLDSLIVDRESVKPLVLDFRINSELQIDRHTYTPFHYIIAMFIENEIPMSQLVMREHFGWDEYNDWWYYEQRWKIMQDDKQQKFNGEIMPLKAYAELLGNKLTELNLANFTSIKRPLYIIVNKSFLSHYYPLIQSLQLSRDNTFVIFEKQGKLYTKFQNLKKYPFEEFEFILNPRLYVNKTSNELNFELIETSITRKNISDVIKAGSNQTKNQSQFSYQIKPKRYVNIGTKLTIEEKILGIIKIWTIVKNFYPFLSNCSVNWDNVLGVYLEMVQQTDSDKEYYLLIEEMMATLNDSHVSTFHPSILDFSEIFVAPVQFDWIENKVIITAIDSSIKYDIHIGDEIVRINNKTIDNILEEESKRISSSNRQGLLSTIINPGYFIGAPGSHIKFDIKSRGKQKTIELTRTKYIFQFMGFGDNRPSSSVFDNNIGYLNLAALSKTSELENELIKMKDTKSLILDLRNSYPTADFQTFLQMLCQNSVIARQSEVPIISAKEEKVRQYEVNEISPDPSFSYSKSILVLIDKTMISRPEDIAISLKSFPNVRFVGEQTQGTDGEVTKIHLPGGGETSFTGQIIRFGNGEKFQQKGIIPDIKVQRTIDGVMNNKDEILDKAIEILSKN